MYTGNPDNDDDVSPSRQRGRTPAGETFVPAVGEDRLGEQLPPVDHPPLTAGF
jgi:hypothetical protein